MSSTIGIIGGGFVGTALKNFFTDALVYDKYKDSDALDEVLAQQHLFVCVPTPYIDRGFDKSYLEAVFSDIAQCGEEKVVIIKSTVLPGTTDDFQRRYPHLRILFNPEFLTEVTAEQDYRFPDRQIIGYTEKSFRIAKDVMDMLPLAPFERIVPAKEAEVIKYFNNTWFATKVTFANQFYDLCEKIGVSYDMVKECAGADRRMTGKSHLDIFHKGYRGYGGKCLPKDTRALIDYGDTQGVSLDLLKIVEELNNRLQKQRNDKS